MARRWWDRCPALVDAALVELAPRRLDGAIVWQGVDGKVEAHQVPGLQ
jgi:Na+-transporting NADH:ubiquinone oxidoreductase subunit NqrB